jgi:hypothetical protein
MGPPRQLDKPCRASVFVLRFRRKTLSREYVMEEFDRLVRERHLAFVDTSEGGKKSAEQINPKEFDPEVHTRVTMVPPFVGG